MTEELENQEVEETSPEADELEALRNENEEHSRRRRQSGGNPSFCEVWRLRPTGAD